MNDSRLAGSIVAAASEPVIGLGFTQTNLQLAIPKMEAVHGYGDWRNALLPDSRLRITNKIVGTLRRHLPSHGEEGTLELRAIASRFEDKIYNTATSQSDYLRRISLKMLTMESQAPGSSAPGHSFNAPPYDEY